MVQMFIAHTVIDYRVILYDDSLIVKMYQIIPLCVMVRLSLVTLMAHCTS